MKNPYMLFGSSSEQRADKDPIADKHAFNAAT
jgi:hypothetical protein